MDTNLLATNSVVGGAAALEPHANVNWGCVIGLMLLGAFIGTLALWCYQLTVPSSTDKKDPWIFLKNFGMGLGAVALVPAVLQTISSNLLTQASTNVDARFILVSFCVAAAYASRRFLAVVPEKILDSLKTTAEDASQAKAKAEAAQSQTAKLTEVVANKTASASAMSQTAVAPAIQTILQANGYDTNCLLVIQALFDSQYPAARTVAGMAMDTGLTTDQVSKWARRMELNGDVEPYAGDPTRGTWWRLTDSGKTKLAALQPQSTGIQVFRSNIQ